MKKFYSENTSINQKPDLLAFLACCLALDCLDIEGTVAETEGICGRGTPAACDEKMSRPEGGATEGIGETDGGLVEE